MGRAEPADELAVGGHQRQHGAGRVFLDLRHAVPWHDHPVIDGCPAGADQGYAGAFGCRLVAGKSVGLLIRDGQPCLTWAGEELPYACDEVIHAACCEPAAFNLAANGTMVWFRARRDGWWWYVDAGVYAQP